MSGKQKMLMDALHGAIEELTIDSATPEESYEIISNLVKRGAEVNSNYGPSLKTPLHRSVELNRTDLLKLFVENGRGDVNLKDKTGWTPLHNAASSGRIQIVRYLLSHGGKRGINYQDVDGETPLHLAGDWGSEPVFDALLAGGADRSIVNHEGEKAIDLLLDASYTANLKIDRRKKYLAK